MKTPVVTISFDGSFNFVMQTGQMNLNVISWDTGTGAVKFWYLDSTSLGHTTHNDIL